MASRRSPYGLLVATTAVVLLLLFAQETAEGAMADRMTQALDKYQAMARQNGTTRRKDEDNVPAGGVRWQSDPAAATNNL